jgi:hypothetical protein
VVEEHAGIRRHTPPRQELSDKLDAPCPGRRYWLAPGSLARIRRYGSVPYDVGYGSWFCSPFWYYSGPPAGHDASPVLDSRCEIWPSYGVGYVSRRHDLGFERQCHQPTEYLRGR